MKGFLYIRTAMLKYIKTIGFVLAAIAMLGASEVLAQSAVVSSYFRTSLPADQWTEILVLQDNLDMQGWTLRDNNQTQTGWMPAITFSNPALWNHVRTGTVIVVWHRKLDGTGATHSQDINPDDGYLELWANDPIYFSGGDFTTNTTLNIAAPGDIIELRDAGGNHVHALGHIAVPGTDWNALPSPKLNHITTAAGLGLNNALFVVPGTDATYYGTLAPQNGTSYTNVAVAPNTTRGLPNWNAAWPTQNAAFWRLTREPLWPVPNLTAVSQTSNTQVLLSWTAAPDPFPSDNTLGYIILRSSTGAFGTPADGHTYNIGDAIGGAAVIAMVPNSQPPTYTDNITIPCGTSMYYRVYPYRYTTDLLNGNDYPAAPQPLGTRGRAYNTTAPNFGVTQVDILTWPLFTSVVPTDATCAGNDGTITITATSTATPLQYSIDNGVTYQASNIFGGLPPGNYIVVVKDVNGCRTVYASNPVVIGTIPGVTAISVVKVDATCSLSNGSITVTPTGGVPPLQYSIDNGVTYQASNVFNALPAGSYTVKVKDNNNCELAYPTNPVVVGNTAGVSSVTATPGNSTCGLSNGTITVGTVGGTAPIQYSIDNGATYQALPNFTGLLAGSYTVVVKDANNCVTPFPANPVVVSNTAGASIDGVVTTSATCVGNTGSITVTASGGAAPLQYSDDGGITWQGANVFSNLPAGSYLVMVMDANNCQTSYATNPVTVGSLGGAAIDGIITTDAACGGSTGSITVNASGGTFPLQYSDDGGLTWQGANVFSNLPAGSYTVAVIDANSCQTFYATNPVIVGSIGGAAIDGIITTDATCGGSNGSITVNASGGTLPLQYSDDGGLTWQVLNVFPNLPAGSYPVIVIDGNNCQTPYATNPVIVGSIGGAAITGVTPTPATCGASNGSITINASGGTLPLQYSIDGGTNWQALNVFSNLPAGPYTVVVMDGNNCQTPYATNPVSVNSAGGASITATPVVNTTCGASNGKITVNATGGAAPLQYSIDMGLTWQISNVFNSLIAGNYTILINDANNCQTTSSNIPVIDLPAPVIPVPVTTNATNGLATGTVSVTATGSTAVLEYSINGGTTWQANNGSFTGLLPGPYTMTVRDANGCISTVPFTIGNTMLSVVSFQADSSKVCQGNTVLISVKATGMVNFKNFGICLTYNSAIAQFTGTSAPNPLLSASILSTDSSIPNQLLITWTGPVPTTVPDGDILFEIGFTGIASGRTTIDWNDFSPGICGVFNNAGIEMTATFNPGSATFYLTPVAAISGSPDICDGFPLVLDAAGATLTHLWTLPGGGTFTGQQYSLANPTAADSGPYILLTSNSFGCSDKDTLNVTIRPNPVISISAMETMCSGFSNLLRAGGGYASYLWQPDGSQDSTYVANQVGTYSVIVTDIYGCVGKDTAYVVECPDALLIPDAFTPNGDLLNDVFRAIWNADVNPTSFSMIIHNQWGRLVFESHDVTKGWDGKVNGMLCPLGVYTYVISVDKPAGKSPAAQTTLRGLVTLVR
jgi:gliding motility-associated-like protein